MPLLDLVTLPVRLTVAAAQTTLALGRLTSAEGPIRREGGYADRLTYLIGEGGLADRTAAVMTAPDGPMSLVSSLAAAFQDDRPLGRAMAQGGTLDRLLKPGGPLDRLLVEEGLLDRLLTEDGFLDKLIAEGGTLDQLIELGRTLETIQPRLAELAGIVPELHASVDALNRAVEPLSGLANRVPLARRKAPAEA